MTILNTYEFWPTEFLFVLLVVLAATCAIFSVISALAEEKGVVLASTIFCMIVSMLAIAVYHGTERVERHKIYANELTYSEILERYNVIETEGLIITVEEKEPSAQ